VKSHTYSIFSAFTALCLLTGCAELEQPPGAASTGTQPELELFGAEVRMTRGEKLLFTIHAPHISRFEPQQLMIFDGGIKVDFYDSEGKHNAIMTSDKGIVKESANRLDAKGNVIVKSDSGLVLLADSLYYVQDQDRVMSDGFVTVITESDSLSGFGFSSAPDLNDWVIFNSSGTTWRKMERSDRKRE